MNRASQKRPFPVLLWLCAAAALTVVGCRSSSPQNSYVVREHLHQVEDVVVDRRLATYLKILSPISERRQGRMEVQVQLQNDQYRELKIEWQVEWYDAAGIQVAAPTNWAAERLGGGQIKTIRQVAPTESANSMRINVRKSDAIEG